MTYSIGVEYALHCLIYLIDPPDGKAIGIKDLSAYQGVSESYLSKFFTKLKKAGIVDSIPGVKGGYKLSKKPKDITFWDVVEAIEGDQHIFNCCEIRKQEAIFKGGEVPESHCKQPCTIKKVMWEAEDKMRAHLQSYTLDWLNSEVGGKVSPEYLCEVQNWFQK